MDGIYCGLLLSFPSLKFREASGRARDNVCTETAGGVRGEMHEAGSRLARDIKTSGDSRILAAGRGYFLQELSGTAL